MAEHTQSGPPLWLPWKADTNVVTLSCGEMRKVRCMRIQSRFNPRNFELHVPLAWTIELEMPDVLAHVVRAVNSHAQLVALAHRVVEVFQPMHDKGQNGQTFDLILERAKSALETAGETP